LCFAQLSTSTAFRSSISGLGAKRNTTLNDIIYYSLIIDETTDLSLKKSLAIVVRYLKNDKVLDSFLDLIEVDSADANSLYLSVKSILDEDEIPYSNLVGLAADNANVMLGKIRSVQTLLKQNINSNIVVIGCSCHSFNLCSSYACCQKM
jgi:hypothetical protein